MILSYCTLVLCLVLSAVAKDFRHGIGEAVNIHERALRQNIVTWDEHSLFVNGTRILFYSGDFHPFRLPVPGLWLDIFQKIKSLGYNGVSFYVDWALLEGQPGVIRDTGIFDLDPFFDAALQAGIYLLARPGPYINAEVSGGGFPGWLQGIDGQLRTNESAFVDTTKLYVSTIGAAIAKHQITEGGPIVLVQVENEYSLTLDPNLVFPDIKYYSGLEQMYLDAGIVVPLTNNDAFPIGRFAPGTPAAVDLYGYDSYPLGFDCSHPEDWTTNPYTQVGFQTYLWASHESQSPTTPNCISEFQGGSGVNWGGSGYEDCLKFIGPEFQRVFWKNNVASGVTMNNFYMFYGGTNWGNLGYPEGITSYDYAAVISEERLVTRQKYSEAKLIANFLQTSPAILTSVPGALSNSTYNTNTAISVTPLFDSMSNTKFYVTRHTNYISRANTNYKLVLNTTQGIFHVPRITGHLTLQGRDTKISVADYSLGSYNILYCTAEIFTWGNDTSKTILAVYGNIGERHELALSGISGGQTIVQVMTKTTASRPTVNGTTINWVVGAESSYLIVNGNMFVYLVNRQDAYNWWTLPVSAPNSFTPSSGQLSTKFVASASYLLRNVTVAGTTMSLVGDLNATTPLEIFLGAPTGLKTLQFNKASIPFTQDSFGIVKANLTYIAPSVNIPDISSLHWKYHDSLPEIQPSYDDSLWPSANLKKTKDLIVDLQTPTSLISSDYGFNTGSLLFRGHFIGKRATRTGSITVEGGTAFGYALWLNSTFVGSWPGNSAQSIYQLNFTLPDVQAGARYVLTVVQDFMGYEEEFFVGEGMKEPRGIIDFSIAGVAQRDVQWKITGNLGGQNYTDLTRGPLNEGGLYVERQGWHLPDPPTANWTVAKPSTGISGAGIGFYATTFDLNMPVGYDVPLAFVFGNSSAPGGSPAKYRVQLFINGYQFGKYINHIGPQSSYPVPEGILNYHGTNYLALTLWSMTDAGAAIRGLKLQVAGVIQTGYGTVEMAPTPSWTARPNAY